MTISAAQKSVVTIAIDGPAASGKGTIARKLADYLDYAYLDTGALYRAIALTILQAGDDPSDRQTAIRTAQQLDMTKLDEPEFLANLRLPATSKAASLVAAEPDVRAAILTTQRQFAAAPPEAKAGAILDGRDIGTVVCPDADKKLFITASADIRAERRWKELVVQDKSLERAAILADIEKRDKADSTRATAPLKQAEDAHLLDTSNLSIEEAFEAALALVKS